MGKKLVPSSGTYLCSMQGYMCRIATLGGKSPLDKTGNQATKDIKYGFAWLEMRQAQAIWMKIQIQGSQCKAQEDRKSS